jgi:hypothetical protein
MTNDKAEIIPTAMINLTVAVENGRILASIN